MRRPPRPRGLLAGSRVARASSGARGRADRVAIAVSGGADSVALTWLLAAARPARGAGRSPASSTSITNCAARSRTPTRRSAARSPRGSTCRLPSQRRRGRAGARAARVARSRGARLRATRSSDGGRRPLERDRRRDRATRWTIRPKPCCCACCAAPAAAGSPASAPARGALIRPLLDCRRAESARLSRRRAARPFVTTRRMRTRRSRAIASATRCMPVIERALAPAASRALARFGGAGRRR